MVDHGYPPDNWDYIESIYNFCAFYSISYSRFGRNYARDPRLYWDYTRMGRVPTKASQYALWTYMHEYMERNTPNPPYGILKCV